MTYVKTRDLSLHLSLSISIFFLDNKTQSNPKTISLRILHKLSKEYDKFDLH